MPKKTRGGVVTALLGLLVLAGLALVLAGCTGEPGATGPQGPPGPQGEPGEDATVACVDCHNETDLISAKRLQYSYSGHNAGLTLDYAGARDNCTACHSGSGFVAWQEQGGATNDVEAPANNTKIDCRSCHEIHTTYSEDDFALRNAEPVSLITDSSQVYDAGTSNLCVNCHQARTAPPVPGGGTTSFSSSHFGPHHGPQANFLLSIGGYGVTDDPNPHATEVEGGCVTCHMADDSAIQAGGHTFKPSLEGCQDCHTDLDTFNRHDVQTETQAMLDQLEALLEQQGVMHDGHPVTGQTFTEDQIGAYWNWILVTEDGSLGVHNSYYASELLKKSIADLS